MAIVLVTNSVDEYSPTNAGFTTSALNTTGANFLVVAIGWVNSGSCTITDSKANTWTALTKRSDSAREEQLFYAENATTGTGHTFTCALAGGNSHPAMVVAAYSGVATSSAFDKESSGVQGFSSAVQTGSVTPAGANSLLFTGLQFNSGGNPTLDSSFTVLDVVEQGLGFQYVPQAAGHQIQTTITARNPTWSAPGGSSTMITQIAVFKVGGAAGISAQLAATEAADTAAITGSVAAAGISAQLAATEGADTASINAGITGTAQLAATEATDTAAISGSVFSSVAAQLAATETSDTAAITAQGGVVVQLNAIEAADTAAIAGGTVTWFARIAATEDTDTAAIRARVQPWALVGIGATVETVTTSHTLTVPSGVAAGDLLVAVISTRQASTSPITLPSGGEWTLAADRYNNNVATDSTAQSSGFMAFCIRGASNPNTTFTHAAAPDVAIGKIFAYRGIDTSTPLEAALSTNAPTATSLTVLGVVTTTADALTLIAACGGQEGTWSAFDATSPSIASSGTVNATTHPTDDTWLLRASDLSTTGSDVSLGYADAVKLVAGNMGFVTCSTTISSQHVVLVAAFKPISVAAIIAVRLAATEAADTAAFDATLSAVGISVQLAATEAADTTAIAGGTVTWFGQLSATEAADTASINAGITGTAQLAATEAADTAAISGGTVTWLARLAATEAADTAAIRADIVGAARLAATEAADVSALNAAIVGAGVACTLTATEAADVSALSATVTGVAGRIAATEAADTAAISVATAWDVRLAAIEAGDVSALSATVATPARLAATEASDTAAINVAIVGTAQLVATEGVDIAAFNAAIVGAGVACTLTAQEAADTASITAAVTGTIVRLAATEGADTAAVTAVVLSVTTGQLAATEAADTAAVTGAVTGVAGRLVATETNDTAALNGLVQSVVICSLAAVEASDVAAIRALANAFGRLVAVEGADTARFSSARINQVNPPGFIARQSPKPNLIARDDAPPDVVARRNATPNLIAGP